MESVRGAIVQVMVSAPSARVAHRLARALLEARLVACAQVLGPMTSHYRWQGKVEKAREYLLVLKSRRSLLARLEREIVRLHPYDVPEVVAMPVQHVHAPYAAWLRQETSAP